MSATPSLVLSQGNRAARSPKFRIRRQRGELRRPNRGSRCAHALTAWQTAKSQYEINTRQVETLREAVRKTELLMSHSGTTYLEILTAQQSLLEAEQLQLQTSFERIQSIIKLYHALGGGRS